MQDISRYLWALIGALILLTLLFGIAAIIVPGFRDSAATAALIASILGPLTTAVSILGGITLSKGVKQAVREEASLGPNAVTKPRNAQGENGV